MLDSHQELSGRLARSVGALGAVLAVTLRPTSLRSRGSLRNWPQPQLFTDEQLEILPNLPGELG